MAPLSPTISICVRGEHLVDYIPFLRSGHRIGPSPIIINKVLLAHSRAQHLHTVCGCFHIAAAELSHYSRDHITQKDKNIYYSGPLQKQFADPWFRLCKGENTPVKVFSVVQKLSRV